MSSEENRSMRGAKKKECRRCGFNGKVNDDKLCGKCEDDVRAKKELCGFCEWWVDDDGVGCDRCGFWFHGECEGMDQRVFEVVKSLETWFCKSCSHNAKKNMEEQYKLKQENSKMKDELKTLRDKNAAICQRLENIECKVNRPRPTPNVSGETNQNEGEKDKINELREELRMLKVANDEVRDMIKDLDKKWIERENELVRKVTEVMENIEEMRNQEKR
ncbi:hypothetical protein Pcinc_006117 [Petrolisthes cinctipes]|uniref:PHD-type domain-containing protein n=1 Tax=Petrolisthes cinctipes TaxID=88211 RepID=A0AAE1GC54_PETCI|nr:hypothetical protein Pcinc_006117 [Petrolisthes cinctipes]